MRATFERASPLKKIIEAIKDLINETNFDISSEGIGIEAMDTSHVALVAMKIKENAFEEFICRSNMSIGITMASLSKILKCSNNNDRLTLSVDNRDDKLDLIFESHDGSKESSYELKLMDIVSDSNGIPDIDYMAEVTMTSSEFQKICRDLIILGENITIGVHSNEQVNFSSAGDMGKGNVTIKKAPEGRISPEKKMSRGKRKKREGDDEGGKKKKEKRDAEEINDRDENEARDKEEDSEEDSEGDKEDNVINTNEAIIKCIEPCQLSFSLRYLLSFSKAASLTNKVTLKMHHEAPLLVCYDVQDVGYIRYYLAPKLEDD